MTAWSTMWDSWKSHVAGGNVKGQSQFGNQFGRILTTYKYLSCIYEPAILFTSIYTRGMNINVSKALHVNVHSTNVFIFQKKTVGGTPWWQVGKLQFAHTLQKQGPLIYCVKGNSPWSSMKGRRPRLNDSNPMTFSGERLLQRGRIFYVGNALCLGGGKGKSFWTGKGLQWG